MGAAAARGAADEEEEEEEEEVVVVEWVGVARVVPVKSVSRIAVLLACHHQSQQQP